MKPSMPDNLETTFFLAEHFVAAYSAKRATLSVVETVTESALVYYSCKGKQSGRPFWYRGYRSGLRVTFILNRVYALGSHI